MSDGEEGEFWRDAFRVPLGLQGNRAGESESIVFVSINLPPRIPCWTILSTALLLLCKFLSQKSFLPLSHITSVDSTTSSPCVCSYLWINFWGQQNVSEEINEDTYKMSLSLIFIFNFWGKKNKNYCRSPSKVHHVLHYTFYYNHGWIQLYSLLTMFVVVMLIIITNSRWKLKLKSMVKRRMGGEQWA